MKADKLNTKTLTSGLFQINIFIICFLLLLNIADLYLTHKGLSLGWTEGNPFFKRSVENGNYFWVTMLKLSSISILFWQNNLAKDSKYLLSFILILTVTISCLFLVTNIKWITLIYF